MAPEVDEALLSAYLDGEVTADEGRRVEQMLADSAAWRQFYDELRALRGAFSTLPRHRLGPDFSDRLLRATQEARRSPAPDHSLQIVRPPDREKVRLRLPRHWRAWAWPAVAVAAALFMMLNPAEQPARKLAEAPKEQAMPANLDIGAAPAAKLAPSAPALRVADQDETAPRMESNEAELSSAAAGAPSPADAVSDSANQMAPLSKASSAGATDATPSRTSIGPPIAAKSAAPAQSADGAMFAEQNKQLAGEPLPPGGAPAVAPAAPSASAPSVAAMPPVANEPARGLGIADSPEVKRDASSPSLARRKAGLARARGAAPSPLEEPLDAKVAGVERQLAKAASGVLVVELVAQPDTAGQDALEQLLARHGISTIPLDQKDADSKADAPSEKSKPALGLATGRVVATGAGEMEIEASREQIEAALADLRQRVDEFTSVSVQPAAGSILQQPLAAYSRDATPVSANNSKTAKAKVGRPTKSSGSGGAGGGLGGVAKDAAPEPKAQKPNATADERAAAKQPAAKPADASKSVMPPSAEDRQVGKSETWAPAEPAKSATGGASEDQAAPLRAVFVLRTAEPEPAESAPTGAQPKSK